MTPDRLDALLDRALETGAIPSDATAEERTELERMLGAAGQLRRNASRISAEANIAMPTARARFQRHLHEQQQHSPSRAPISPPRVEKGIFGRFFSGRILTMGTSAAAIAVVLVVALAVLQPFNGVETVSALTIDDYVQVEGVVSASANGVVTVQSADLGNLEIALSDLTSVTDSNGARDISSLKPGDPVLVSGIVTARRAIAASNVAVAENQAVPTQTAKDKARLLKEFREGLQGNITLISFSPDGQRARVLLVMANESLLIDVDPKSMDQFLVNSPRPLGALARVVAAPELAKGVFRLQPVVPPEGTPSASATPPPNSPQFQNVKGTVVGRTLNVLMVRTDRGTVPVVVRGTTLIRSAALTLEDVRSGETVIGYEVLVSGNPEEPAGRRVIASSIVVIGKPAAAPAR